MSSVLQLRIFDLGETELLGCVYIDPPAGGAGPRSRGGSSTGSSTVRSSRPWTLRSPVGRHGLADHPPEYVGHDLTWTEWIALPIPDETAYLEGTLR